ncbi:MAG TPA: GEVED domain-containing protein [Flavobacteriales bacterium]|nr:GEVED domain-containing protein [Flavobacteriales bacterium]
MLRNAPLILALATCLSGVAQTHDHAQRTCGSHAFTQRYLERQGLSTDLLAAMPHRQPVQRGGTFTIPVVVHVVYNNSAENVTTGSIQAIIDELNEDYSASNSDIGSVRASFTNSVANVGFQFCLAQVDPNGNATTGIVRHQTTETWFDPDTETDEMKFAPIGSPAWDPSSYLNIWICDISSGAGGSTITVGYAYLPFGGVVGSDIDGLVIDYDYGTQVGARTATHEIGHYFGLLHTFDDDGNCVNSDGFTDTPTSNSPTFSCSNTNLVKCGVLTQYENFMDYSDCTVMFTDQQAAYMADILGNEREGLLLNNACSGPVTGLCIPTSVNGTADGDYINRVALGTFNNNNSGSVGAPAYTDFSGTYSTALARGTQYTLTVQGGTYNDDNVAAWIDYDQDEVLEASEKLGETAITLANQTVTITFTVPAGAALGNTLLRVRNVFHNDGEPAPTDPCYNYAFGETEDYGITIQSAGGSGPCIPASANGTSDGDYINAVVLENIINLNSGSTGGPTYSDYSATLSATLTRTQPYSVLVQAGDFQPDHYAVWIDYDQDDLFEDAEKLGEFATTEVDEAQTIAFTVPGTAALGTTVMRVRGVFFDTGEPDPVQPCYAYNYGETEDYGIVINAPGSTLCIPTSLFGPSDGDFIDGVQLASIDNTNSGGVDGPAYSDLLATDNTYLTRGASQTLTITSGTYAPDHYSAWIDYDQDLIFEESERLGAFSTSGAAEVGTIPFTVPANAPLGDTRMRVRGVFFGDTEPDPVHPCYSYAYGETEDYGITIETTTGLQEQGELLARTYPNPATGNVTVELVDPAFAHVRLIDPQGRLVSEQQGTGGRIVLDLSSVASGTYYIRIQQGGSSGIQRLEVIAERR